MIVKPLPPLEISENLTTRKGNVTNKAYSYFAESVVARERAIAERLKMIDVCHECGDYQTAFMLTKELLKELERAQ